MPFRTIKKVTPWFRPGDCEVQSIEGGNAATLSQPQRSYDGNPDTSAIVIKGGGYYVRLVWHSFTGEDIPTNAVIKQIQMSFTADDYAEFSGTSDCLGYFSLAWTAASPTNAALYPVNIISGSTSTDFSNTTKTYVYPADQSDGTGGQNAATDEYLTVPAWTTAPSNGNLIWGFADASWNLMGGDVSKLALFLHMDHKYSYAADDGGGTPQSLSLYISDVKIRIFYEIEEEVNVQLKSGNLDVKYGSFTIK